MDNTVLNHRMKHIGNQYFCFEHRGASAYGYLRCYAHSRHIMPTKGKPVQLAVFTDVSEHTYGACIYIKTEKRGDRRPPSSGERRSVGSMSKSIFFAKYSVELLDNLRMLVYVEGEEQALYPTEVVSLMTAAHPFH